jgi:hypothetical protein
VGLALVLLGLPLLGYGGYLLYSAWGMKAAPYSALWRETPEEPAEGANLEDPPPPPPEQEGEVPEEVPEEKDRVNWPVEVLRTRLTGQVCFGAGLLLAWVGLKLLRRRRFFILCQGRDVILKVGAESESQQTQMLMTVQAILT